MPINRTPTDIEVRMIAEPLKELVEEGHLSSVRAIKEMQTELGYSLTYMQNMGWIAYFRKAEKKYGESV